MKSLLALFLLLLGVDAFATDDPAALPEPRAYTYRVVGDDSLEAFVRFPAARRDGTASNAILLFHGGGWVAGSPEWVLSAAERFASYGLVAIAIEYRLSSHDVTPIDALDDACQAFAWARGNAKELGIGDKVAGYGVSAGGHLVAATATVGCAEANAKPDAMLLWSPAVDVNEDGWFSKILQGRAKAIDLSPVDHVNSGTPPTCIVQGAEDTLTPLAGAQRFHDRLVELGGVCELNVYAGVGHLLTRNLSNQEDDFDPDPKKRADGIERHRLFLQRTGFLPH
jgi:acetyl esterase/lipase